MTTYSDKFLTLEKWFNDKTGKIIVALSGGVDSCLVAFLARKYIGKENVLAVISSSPSLKRQDLDIAINFCTRFDINLEIIETKEIEDIRYSSNPVNRCYFCKINLYEELQTIANKYHSAIILNGQNSDDLDDYRPGIKAAEEFRVYHPLADCDLSKRDIREIAQYFNLPVWDKPASPCLSSRIPYGKEVTSRKLKQIEEAENFLNRHGFDDVRVRHYNDLAVIEVPYNKIKELIKIKDEITMGIQALGFGHCEIDSEGLVSGKLNRGVR